MPGMVVALLAGIDDYPDPRHRLSGCLNDVGAFEGWLCARVPQALLKLFTMRNAEVTRDRLIHAFRENLGQAGAGDTAIFFFAGHGSQEDAPEVFWQIEPDHLNETLVMFDSRTENHWDLADKELAALIAEVAAKGARVVVILDSCHSGSGTRALRADEELPVRRIPVSGRKRPIETFLETARSYTDPKSGGTPTPRHILFAACRDDQQAKEYLGAGKRRGCFSYFLVEALSSMPGDFSYRDLFQQTQALVRVSVYDQNPQLEAVNDGDLDLPFLGKGLAARRGGFTVSYHSKPGEWRIDAGSIHGITKPEGAETTKLAIFPASSTASIERIGNSISKATVHTVEPGYSVIEVTGNLDPEMVYRAAIVSLPLPLCRVELAGDPEGVAELRTALKGNLYAAELVGATLRVLAARGKYTIARASDGRELTAAVEGYSYASTVLARLETIAKWNRIATLANPHSKIGEDEFRLTIFSGTEGQKELEDREIRLSYEAGKNNAAPVPPQFRVRVKNSGTRRLYVALLDLDELFAVKSLFAAGSLKLEPGEEAWAFEGKAVRSVIDPGLIKAGATESTDILKLIVSTEDFDPRLLVQGALDAPRTRAASFAAVRHGTLNRMFERVQTRGFEADAGGDETVDDFTTKSIVFTTTLPRPGVRLTTTVASTLDGNVEVKAHPAMRAVTRLTTVSLSRDDLGGAVVPQIFRDSPSQLWNLMPTRGSTPELNALELTAIENSDAVTPAQPLELTIPIELGAGECVLPYSFDGEFYIPAGFATSKDGHTNVTIERLIPNGRSLTGSIRIFFQKFVDSVLGLPFEYPILAGANLDASGKVVYERDMNKVHDQVSKARRVLVFVHGIIGDTRGMPASVAVAPDDAVLTFDYENLDTTIEANAKKLGERLAEAGLAPGHGKELVLIAHSMGGLVSRWFIETLGGSNVVTRLIMMGTPNGGSPWANIEDWVSTTAALAMNGLTKVHWPVTVISGLLRAPGQIDRSLHEMQADSEFLRNLAACPDPGIPYLIIAGDSALIEPAVNGSKIKRLLDKVLHRAASAAFFFEPNDIAVSVANINAVNAGRNPQPIHQAAACDHLTYFSSDSGRDLLRSALAARRTA